MATWLILALLAPLVYTFVNFIDKFLISDKIGDSHAMPLYAASVAAIFGTVVWLSIGMPILNNYSTVFILFSGLATIFAYVAYYHALSDSETSYIIFAMQLVPVLSLLLSFLFLHEALTLTQWLGFLLILTSVLLASVEKGKKTFRYNKALLLIVVADILFASSGILFKFGGEGQNFSTLLSYESWGMALGGCLIALLSVKSRTGFISSIKRIGGMGLLIAFINETLNVTAKSISYYALVLGPVALVSVIGGVQTFYAIAFGALLTVIFPRTFKEKMDLKTIAIKTGLACIMLLGIWLVK
jgi:transporter family protein